MENQEAQGRAFDLPKSHRTPYIVWAHEKAVQMANNLEAIRAIVEKHLGPDMVRRIKPKEGAARWIAFKVQKTLEGEEANRIDAVGQFVREMHASAWYQELSALPGVTVHWYSVKKSMGKIWFECQMCLDNFIPSKK